MNAILDDDLSPMPLLTVILGYWLPLEWILRAESQLGNITLLEKFQVFGSSVFLNFLPATILLAAVVYLGGTLSIPTRFAYRRVIHWWMETTANLLVLLVTAVGTKRLLIGPATAPVMVKGLVLVAALILGAWLAKRRVFLTRNLSLPRLLALLCLPLAAGILTQEIASQPKRLVKNGAALHTSISSRRPDVFLLTLDALSSKHLSSYGYPRVTSPHLDAFAKDAILFREFYANANWTRPGVASLLNGTRPWTHAGDLGRPLRSVIETQNLLGCLARAGYDIRTVSSNPFADHTWQGTGAYFTEQFQSRSHSPLPIFLQRIIPSSLWVGYMGPAIYVRTLISAISRSPAQDRVQIPLAKALEMFGRAPSDQPCFFWVHLIPPHDPYATPSPYLGTFEPSPLGRHPWDSGSDYKFLAIRFPSRQPILEGRYDEGILFADAAFGILVAWLKAHNRFDNSLVVVSSDHGESFSHGYGGHGGPMLWEDLIRVPLLIKPPGHQGAVIVRSLYEQADLTPTILHLAGLPLPTGTEGQAYPLKPDDVPVFAMNRDLSSKDHTFSLAMRQGNWKYVTHFGQWVHPLPQRELYDLNQDPDENMNLIDRRPDIAGPMHQRIMEELAKRGLKPEAS